MSAARALLLLIFGFTMLRFICCYSDGSLLTDQCQSMAIDHGFQASGQDSNPFTVAPDYVIVNSSQVGTGITVTLSASSGSFMGFMLEARECDDCPPAGSFSVLDFNSLLLCSGQVVAHSLSSDKSSVQVMWTPQATGQFFFRAAFVKNFIEFWTKKAIILSTTTRSPPTTTLMTTTPLKTMMTTATTTSTATTTTVTTRRTTLGLTKLVLKHRERRPKGSKCQKGADHRDRGNRGSRERQPDERECD